MRRLIALICAGLLLAGIVPQLLAQDTRQPTSSVLQVVDTEPLAGQELALDGTITIYFDRSLDCATAEDAFQIMPQLAGSLDCTGTAITFTPDEDFNRAATYRVILATSLRGADGAQLLEAYELTLNTVGYIGVTETFPAPGSMEIQPDTTLTIIFNRPVVPLTILEERDTLPDPLTISPPIVGTGEWLNTSIYTFEPDGAFAGNTTYEVTVNEGLEGVDGAVLRDAYSFSFTTQPPRLVEFSPNAGSDDARLDGRVQVRFNMAMDRASVEERFALINTETGNAVSGEFEWADDDAGFSFTPDENLQLGTIYQASFEDGVQSASGGPGGLQGEVSWTFATVPEPSIVSTSPQDGEDDSSPYRAGFTIYFASPMNPETLADRITIEPEPEREPGFYYREWSDSYEVSFLTYPSATYTVTIEPGAEDVYGNVIDEAYTFTYRTREYDPEVSLNTPGPLGFYNASRQPTQVFVKYRNMETFDLLLYDVPLERFASLATSSSSYYYDLPDNLNLPDEALLRRWTVDGREIPENALRYDLLEFGSDVFSLDCASALPSRLSAGETALVITEPDPVRARAAPVDGEIVELLYRDYALTILDRAVCGEDGLLWWPVELRDGTQAWVAESVGEEYLLAPRDPASGVEIPVTDAEGEALPPGIYYLGTRSEQFRDQSHIMIVATANIVLKNSIDSVMAWVTDVQSGQPIANAPVTIYALGYQEVASGTTDADGMLLVDVPPEESVYERFFAVLQTEEHFGVGFSEFTQGIEPYQFEQSFNFFPGLYRIYAYTDRPVYRPGQPVYFRGIARSQDDVSYTAPDLQTIPVTIRDDGGNIIFDEELPLNEYGTFEGEITLDDDASLGYYYLSAELPGRNEHDLSTGGVSFAVAEYRLPEFQVEVIAEEPEVVQGATIEATVNSTFFFGGAVSNARVEYTVISENYFFDYEGEGRFDFVDYNYDAGPSAFYASSTRGAIASGSDTTNEQGEFTIEIPAELGDVSQSQNFLIEATVRDETGQTVAGRTTVTVHQGEVYVGARAESYVSIAGEDANILIATVDWDSEAVPSQTVQVEVVERRWSSVQEQDELGRTTWVYDVEEIPVADGSVTTDADGRATYSFRPQEGGVYKAYVTTRDENGNQVTSSTYLWVSSRSYVSWRQQNSNRIELVSDKEEYSVGETAQILITSPFQGTAEALVTVERGDVLFMERITMESNSTIYELPIEADYSPNIFVSVMIVKGVDENNPVAGFRMGYLQLGVDTEQRELNIEITSDVDRASPQQTVTYTVRTTDWQGEPVSAEVGIGVTDLAALSLAPSNSRPILNYFYGDQSLSVRTSTPLTVNTDQLTQEVLDTIKGGGGGLAGDGIIEIRGEFVDTPYWNPSIVTDDNGEATFDVRLPDNLTTWRLDARAVTLAPDGNMLVGQDTFDLLSTKPLIVRPVTPRFFVVGDEVVLAAVVNNNTDEDLETVVTIDAAGVTLNSDAAQVVTIPSGGRSRVTWDATVQDVDHARMTFTADAGQYSDGSISGVSLDDDGTLPVYKYEAPETVGTAGVLRTADSRAESIVLPQRYDVTQGTLTVQVDQSLAATTLDGLEYLRIYPHYCTEQVVSRFLPNIMTYRALNELGLADPDLEDSLDFYTTLGLQKLYAEQHTNGGWGWFVQLRSDTLVTAYVLIGLSEARAQGYPVPDSVIGAAQDYLRNNFTAPSANQPTWMANRQAFMLYALARSGAPDVQRSAAQFEFRDNLGIYGRALLAETFYYIDPTDTARSDVLLSDISNAAITSAAGIHWEEDFRDFRNWNTDTRTTALVLSALIKLRPNSDLIPNVVRYLMVQRTADAWETTQETAWSVMALTDWMLVSRELTPDYSYNVTFNDDTILEGDATPETVRDRAMLQIDVSEMLQDEANNLVFTRTGSNEGVMYYTSYVEVYLPVPEIEPVDNGIIVERRYVREDTEEVITEARVGEVVEVRLTIVVPNSLHYVVITDPLPAGAEGIDPNLQTSEQIGTRPGLDNDNPLRYGWGWWYFGEIEFRDEAVNLYADYLPAGTYEYVYTIRPSVEGVYNVIPPTAQEFYFPDVYGRGAGSTFTVLPAEG